MAVNTQAIFGVVQREGMEKGFWTRIGTAFQNQDGSWNLRFDYLPTDPTATVQMYVDCWRGTTSRYRGFWDALQHLRTLPPAKRRAVLRAVRVQVRTDVSNLTGWRADSGQAGLRDYILAKADGELSRVPDQEYVADLIADLKRGRRDRGSAVESLQKTCPEPPLVALFAEADESRIRALTIPAVRERPVPRNRALLAKLVEDTDESVRKAATEVKAYLRDLMERPPMDLAQKPTVVGSEAGSPDLDHAGRHGPWRRLPGPA